MLIILTLLLFGVACTDEPEDCLALGGGYGGADVEALEAECRASGVGECCESDDYIEIDAAICLFRASGTSAEPEPELMFEGIRRTVLWSWTELNQTARLRACDGEKLAGSIDEPS